MSEEKCQHCGTKLIFEGEHTNSDSVLFEERGLCIPCFQAPVKQIIKNKSLPHFNKPLPTQTELELDKLQKENALMHQVIKEFNSVFGHQWRGIITTVSRKYNRKVFTTRVEASIMLDIRLMLNDLYPPGFVRMLSVSINSLNKEITIRMKDL